jgi:hypothetical protein
MGNPNGLGRIIPLKEELTEWTISKFARIVFSAVCAMAQICIVLLDGLYEKVRF